jgi:hypothetical protein
MRACEFPSRSAIVAAVSVDRVTVTFSRDQAFVLSHWLDEQLGTRDFDRLVDRDPAVWSAIYVLTGLLKDDAIIFDLGYGEQLEAARARLSEELGEYFIASRVDGESPVPTREVFRLGKLPALHDHDRPAET